MMKGKMKFIAIGLILITPHVYADSEGVLKRGEEIATNQCNACHNTTIGEIPLLFGQGAKYLEDALELYASDKKTDTSTFKSMNAIAKALSKDDKIAVSLYYSEQEPCQVAGTINPGEGDLARGREMVRQCTVCHKKKISSPSGGIPRLVGQKTDYLVHAMKEHRDAIHPTGMMEGVLDSFDDQELADIAAYLNRYGHCEPASS